MFVQAHGLKGRYDEMAREAEKVRLTHPKDWRAICAQAHYAWAKGDRPAALARLSELPGPEDKAARVDLNGLIYSLQLFAQAGRDNGPLRDLIVRRILPILKGGSAGSAPPAVKSHLVECYLEPFADPENLEVLGGYWADASRLAEQAVASAVEAGDAPALAQLGRLGPKMAAALATLRGRLPAERFAALQKEIDERTGRAWEALRTADPKRMESYRGLAALAFAANRPDDADKRLREGLAACGDRVELLQDEAQLLQRCGRADLASDRTWAAAQKAPADLGKWLAAAEAAAAAGRPARVFDACEAARAPRPGPAPRRPARGRLPPRQRRAGKGAAASGRGRVPQAAAAGPGVRPPQARALVAMRSLAADDFLAEIDAAVAARRAAPAAKLAALQGMFLVRPPDPARDGRIAAEARALTRTAPDDPNVPNALLLAALALARRADWEEPPLQRATVRAALQAYDALAAGPKQAPAALAAVARLQLLGLDDPLSAARTAEPLLASPTNTALTPDVMEVLGSVLLRTKKAKQAVSVLEEAVRRPNCAVRLLDGPGAGVPRRRPPRRRQADDRLSER